MSASSTHASLLKATVILGSGSFGAILIGLVSSKAWAIWVGPDGVGHAALLQGIASLIGIVAGMGLASGIVRLGAASAAADRRKLDVLVRAAWSVWGYAVTVAVLLLTACSGMIADGLGDGVRGGEVALMGVVVAATAATTLQNGVINAYHRVETLAWVSVLGPLLGNCVSLPLLAGLGVHYVTWALTINAVIACAVSTYACRQVHQPASRPGDEAFFSAARRELLKFGLPMAVSMLLGAGVQYVMPLLIIRQGTEAEIGYYRAASAIAFGCIAFLLTALGQDYYPRLAAVRDDPAAMILRFRQQFRFTFGLALPLMLGMLVGSRWLVPLFYSYRFAPAAALLDWLIFGMIFKLAGLSMGYLVLACCPGRVLLVTETTAGVVWLGGAWLGLQWFQLDGLGMAFAAANAVHALVVGAIVVRYVGWAMGWKQMLLFAGAIVAAAGILFLKHF